MKMEMMMMMVVTPPRVLGASNPSTYNLNLLAIQTLFATKSLNSSLRPWQWPLAQPPPLPARPLHAPWRARDRPAAPWARAFSHLQIWPKPGPIQASIWMRGWRWTWMLFQQEQQGWWRPWRNSRRDRAAMLVALCVECCSTWMVCFVIASIAHGRLGLSFSKRWGSLSLRKISFPLWAPVSQFSCVGCFLEVNFDPGLRSRGF